LHIGAGHNNRVSFLFFIKKFREPITLVILFVVYFLSAKLGLMLDAVSGFATLVWAPSGIALAAILLLGYRAWPAIAWAAFVINFQNDATVLTAMGIAVGNTLEALAGAYILRKFTDFHLKLDRQKDILYLFIAIISGATISAALGTVSTALGGVHGWEGFFATGFAWWVGNIIGSLIVTPFIIVWVSTVRRYTLKVKEIIEILALGFLLVVICEMIFSTSSDKGIPTFKFLYAIFPFIVWGSLRFYQLGNVTVILIISALTIWGTSHGLGPFSQGSLRENLYLLHSFLGVIICTGLFLSSTILERQKALDSLKKAEERVEKKSAELHSSKLRKTVIFEASLDSIITIDQKGNILEFNPAAEKTFGHKKEKVLGLEMADLIIPERYRDAYRKGLAHFLSTGNGLALGKRLEMSAIKSDGTEFPVELSIIASKVNGEPFFTGFLRDISESKKSAQELERAKNKAEVANQTKSAFLANMSHEIRTPLGAILGFSELIVDPTITASDKLNFTSAIQRNGELLSNIINDILDLSKVEAGKLQIDLQKTSIESVLLDMVSLLKLRADEKGIGLSISYGRSLPDVLTTDVLRLRQILINIVGNAIKFTEHGSVNVEVKLISEKKNSKLAFIVKDTGCGISEEHTERLFQTFSQGDISTQRKFGGTGLGLVLSKKLANLLGGDLVLTHSELGKGSTFTITVDPDLQADC
jgi:PAS domain S-box-containing protein